MKKFFAAVVGVIFLACCAPASKAQVGDVFRRAQEKAQKAKKVADIYKPWTPEQEHVLGEAASARLVHIFGLYENPDMVRYVNLVGNTVARQAGRDVPYHFAVLDTEVVTALSLPGGYIFVTRGALANMRNESELAGTLAHEVAHVDARHLEREVRAKKSSQFAKEEAATRVPQGAELVNLAGDLVNGALTTQVSRDKETEADKTGTELAAKAGYDPAGLKNFLELLALASDSPQNRKQLGLWGSTHPPFRDRVAALTVIAAGFPSGGKALTERFNWYVNPVNFAKSGSSSPASGHELSGIVSKGVVVLQGDTLPEGTRVKIRVDE
jgi:beta-barrel assembly-enhancing protease